MDEELKNRLDIQEEKLDKIFQSTERTRKIFLWTLIITLAMFILPLIGLMFVVPSFMDSYIGTLGGL